MVPVIQSQQGGTWLWALASMSAALPNGGGVVENSGRRQRRWGGGLEEYEHNPNVLSRHGITLAAGCLVDGL